jgi:hypothetical protein
MGANSNHTGKYSKLFGPSKETESATKSSFDPSTIASTISPQNKNSWNNRPPMNVSFNRRQCNRVSHNVTSDEDDDSNPDDIIDVYKKEYSGNSGYGKSLRKTSDKSHLESIQSEVSASV